MPVVSAASTSGCMSSESLPKTKSLCPTPVKILSQQETINSEKYAFKPQITSFVKAKPVFWRLLALTACNHIYFLIYIYICIYIIYIIYMYIYIYIYIRFHDCWYFSAGWGNRTPCNIHVYIRCSRLPGFSSCQLEVLTSRCRTSSPWKVTKEGGVSHPLSHQFQDYFAEENLT